MELLVAGVLAVLATVAVTSFAPRVGVAAPLLLLLLGTAVSFLPFVPAVEVEPEIVLGVVLPPLLYSSAATIPTMELRRDVRTVSAFSVLLVVASALAVGFVLDAVVPGIGLATGIAIGAVVSPTDAVATSVVRKAGVSPRVVTVLEGESLLNDASALVLLRSAVVATAGTVSLLEVGGDFVLAVVVAVAVGYVVGRLHVWARAHITQTTSTVAISFVVPFVAYLPAEHLGASGLVAAVTAGLVTGRAAHTALSAQDRVTERAVWRTLELLLESTVLLLMGVQLFGLVEDVRAAHGSLWTALGYGVLTATVVVAVRAVFVGASVWELARRARRIPQLRDWLTQAQERLDAGDVPVRPGRSTPDGPAGGPSPERVEAVGRRVRRRLADIDYLTAEAFGPREATLLVWAGMRGAVTLAAAQSLPSDTPQRSLLVLVAFVVAAGTLLVQGATLPWVVRRLGLGDRAQDDAAALVALRAEVRDAALAHLQDPALVRPDGQPYDPRVLDRARAGLAAVDAAMDDEDAAPVRAQVHQLMIELVQAQRAELLRLRDLGVHSSAALDRALDEVDAVQIGLEMRGP
ncbi:cation:proton antiporter [Cellulomonas oligotrophica]|uniref:CPA1 family monovalent cation:H+ antiporter n=1 Tax=Cellulomonas oligotrophica TaxID=931536 RepID=A0A7Y9JYI2_9CELL|nr:sodium:proton antiporter [Cellulomonas oligotrophica]NYD86931.1 CPA1 family monovalent cation:H+ antiporter [Cellulomonas oligotrophica]GIG32283.1 peptidase [Cellulomonas oligotrophica]